MTEKPQDQWNLNEEDAAYFERLNKTYLEEKISKYLSIHTKPLMDDELLAQKIQNEINSENETTISLIEVGYSALRSGLEKLLSQLDPEESQKVQYEMDRWTGMLIDLGPYSEFLKKVIQTKKTLQDAFYLSNESISCFYQVGREYLNQKKYDQASGLFYLLIQLNSNLYEFWLGMAVCFQEQKLFDEAIKAYQKAKEMRPEDPTFDILIAECYLSLSNTSAAEDHLHTAKELLNESENFDHLKAKCRRLLKKVKTVDKPVF
ncbi:tetratricopeptide repeat protein [Chlamydiales bacterium]|nr:tetratricopeptide repeat protein [Chlamydiales bacterium]